MPPPTAGDVENTSEVEEQPAVQEANPLTFELRRLKFVVWR